MGGFMGQQPQQGQMQSNNQGFVAQCNARDCSYNENMKCFAEGINVKIHSDQAGLHADCDTYTKNQHMT